MAQRRWRNSSGRSPMLKDRRNGQRSKGEVIPLAVVGRWRGTRRFLMKGQRSRSKVTRQVQMSSGDPLCSVPPLLVVRFHACN